MKTADVFPSRYLKAEEIDEPIAVTIESVTMETLKNKSGEEEHKPVVYFAELDKGLILNKTNWEMIVKQHGDDSDNWTGKRIILTTVDVQAFGDVVSAIRVKAPKASKPTPVVVPSKPANAKPAPVVVEDDEPHGKADELPF